MQHKRNSLSFNIIAAAVFGIVLLALATTRASALPVTQLVFVGNEHIRSTELVTAATASPNPIDRDFAKTYDLIIAMQQVQERVIARYRREGYIFAEVDSSWISLAVPVDSSQGLTLTFRVREGLRYTVGSIALKGAKQLDSTTLRALLQTSIRDPLDETVLKADINAILKAYAAHGLPFARVDIASITIDSIDGHGEINITLKIDEGRSARIGKIVIEGNTSTDRDVIVRELRVPIGSVYDPVELTRARDRLERLGYFEAVSEPDLYLLNDSTVALVIRVKEANTSQVDGVLGYNPGRTPNEAGYISGLLELAFRNISGTARDASLHYSRENELSQVLEVRYLEPWLFGYPLNLGLSYSQRQQDTSFTRTAIGGQLILAMKEDLSLSLSAASERVIPTDLPNYPFIAYDSRSIVTGLTGRFDSRDDPYAPRSGIRAELGASYARKTINGPARFIDSTTPISQDLQTIVLDAAGYHDILTPRMIGVLALHAGSISASQGLLDQSDLFRLGGFGSIRGYRDAELLASRFGYGTTEVRFMTGRQSFLFSFLDAGVLVKDSTKLAPTEQVQYPLSYGLGIQLESPLGLLSVSIALAKGEPFDQAKFHFGLVKQF